MLSLSLKQMEDACEKQYKTLEDTVQEITLALGENEGCRIKKCDDLRELCGKIKVFMSGKLKQLNELIGKFKEIQAGGKPQTEPPLYINDVQGYYDLTMIEARDIEERTKELMSNNVHINITRYSRNLGKTT